MKPFTIKMRSKLECILTNLSTDDNNDNHNTKSSLSTEQSYELEGICDALTKFPQTGSSTKNKSFVAWPGEGRSTSKGK